MTKSELIERITEHQSQLSSKDVELAVKTLLEQMSQALSQGDRIEIRGSAVFHCTIVRRVLVATPKPANRLGWPANTCPISSRAKNCVTG